MASIERGARNKVAGRVCPATLSLTPQADRGCDPRYLDPYRVACAFAAAMSASLRKDITVTLRVR